MSRNQKDTFGRFFLIFGSVFLLLGVPILLLGRWSLVQEWRFAEQGKTADGTILSMRVEESSDSDNKKTLSHILKYSFSDQQGRKVEYEDSINHSLYGTLKVGDKVTVQYLPDNPSINSRVVDGEENDTLSAYMLLGLGTFCSLVGIGALIPAWKNISKRRRLARDGAVTEGTITSIEEGSLEVNDVRQYRISYTYRDRHGKVHAGISHNMEPHIAREWSVGEKGKVRFHKTQSELSEWVGD